MGASQDQLQIQDTCTRYDSLRTFDLRHRMQALMARRFLGRSKTGEVDIGNFVRKVGRPQSLCAEGIMRGKFWPRAVG